MRLALAIGATLAIAGCSDQSMVQQKRYSTYAPSPLWSNGTSSRPLPDGVVAQGDLQRVNARANPPPISELLLQTGQQQFDIFCSPCHGRSGDGHGMIVERGFPAPPPLDADRLRSASAQHLFDVITDGYGVMYPFASRIDPADRWAVVAYIRALQLSQHSQVADLPEAREKLP